MLGGICIDITDGWLGMGGFWFDGECCMAVGLYNRHGR